MVACAPRRRPVRMRRHSAPLARAVEMLSVRYAAAGNVRRERSVGIRVTTAVASTAGAAGERCVAQLRRSCFARFKSRFGEGYLEASADGCRARRARTRVPSRIANDAASFGFTS